MIIRLYNTYEPVSNFYRDLIPSLTDQGVEIEIVISRAQYRRGRDLAEALQNEESVRYLWTPNFGLNGYQGRGAKMIIMLMFALRSVLYAIFGSGVNLNVFLTQPPLIPLLGYLAKKLRNQPYYCVLMDIQPQLSVGMGLIDEEALPTKVLSRLNELAIKNAKGVIVIGRCMAERVEALGVAPERIHFIPNWADEEKIYPVAPSENQLRHEQGWDDSFVFLYTGNIGIPQRFDDFLEVSSRLANRSDIKFVFIGEGSRQNLVAQRIKEEKLTNVTMLPFLHEHHSLAEILSSGDLQLVTLRDGVTGYAVPSKAYGVLAAGRPMIYQGSADGEIARMIDEERIGVIVPHGDVEGLETALLAFVDNPERGRSYGCRARTLADSSYSRQSALLRYAQVLLGNNAPLDNDYGLTLSKDDRANVGIG